MKNAIIYFLRPEEGGRKTLPTSTTYYATTKIENFSPVFWSIVIQFEKPLGIHEYTSSCKVTFLVDTAPYSLLEEINDFFVYEGPKKIAKIVIKKNNKSD
jgi:hypothetical protein